MTSCPHRTNLRNSLNHYFGSIPDPRVERTRAHQLIDIITIALLVTLSGSDGWCAIETYGLAKQEWLESFLDLPNGIPSHDTFARVFSRLDPVLLETQFQEWVKLNLLRQKASRLSLKMKRYKTAMDNQFLLKVLSDQA